MLGNNTNFAERLKILDYWDQVVGMLLLQKAIVNENVVNVSTGLVS